jgi:type IV fimbrial biogenesis protein FimT
VLNGRRHPGFTLIELLVGLAIVSILIVSALPSYSAWIQNTKIRNAAESVQNGLQLARSEAVLKNTNVQFAFGIDTQWTVSVVAPVQTIQSRAAEQGSLGVLVTRTPGTSTLTFNSLGRVIANADGSASFTQVDLDMSDITVPANLRRPLRVTISAAGRVRMCDPSITDASDTRAC